MWPLKNFDVNFSIILIAAVVSHLVIVLGLRDVKVHVPSAVRKGEKAILKCTYDIEGDSLYSVKWYKGRREFYRYTPKENPAMKVFIVPGVKVERHTSNESQLTLESVGSITSGKYSCEVSADAPSFHTLISSGELEVVEIPNQKPIITGIRLRYSIGDKIRGNCTSKHSKPAANLTWTINDHEANPSLIRTYKTIHESIAGLETSISQIQFVVTQRHFINGKLKIRCRASIHDVYWQSTEKSIEEERPKVIKAASSSNVNLIQSYPYDQISLQDGETIDKKDTYMTYAQGDMSSLNSGAGSLLLPSYSALSSPLIMIIFLCALQFPHIITLSIFLIRYVYRIHTNNDCELIIGDKDKIQHIIIQFQQSSKTSSIRLGILSLSFLVVCLMLTILGISYILNVIGSVQYNKESTTFSNLLYST